MLVSQSAVRYRCIGGLSFSLDPAMRSISSAELRDYFRSPTAIVPMKSSNTFVLIGAKKLLKRDGDKMQLW